MKIIKLIPRGYCKGVVLAIKTLDNALKNYPDKNIYCLGWIVHNKHIVEQFMNKKVTFLDDRKTSRYDLIKNLNDKNAVVVFSAHGTSDDVFALAKQKNIQVLDATCEYVSKIHDIIKQKMHDYKIIYIGKKNHPESIATLAISQDIIFIDVQEAILNQSYLNLKIDPNEQYYVLNQTTIALYDYYKIIKYLSQFNNVTLDNEICDATTKRQEAVIKMDPSVQLLIVVGDQKSNNSNQLVNCALQKGVQAYLVSDQQDIQDKWFKDIDTVAVTAGTSTPTEKINEVINYLKNWE